jgi:hypothetical protein
MRGIVAFGCGVLFAVGLGIAGMTDPHRVLAFLDVGGAWDPSLMLVMVGAIGVNALVWQWVRRRGPVLTDRVHLPERTRVDAQLVMGALIFGVGWGLGGYCPGPAVVSLVTLDPAPMVFVYAMFLGILLPTLFAYFFPRRPAEA